MKLSIINSALSRIDTIEVTLNAELDDHLSYAKHEKSSVNNSHNGFSSKTLITDEGQFELITPHD